MWAGALIKPIPKSRDKDPCVPLNYRGISLLCTTSEVYSSVLNNRINKYFNMLNLLSDYQNGFRKGRSCEDHAFTLSTVLRNRIQAKQSTFISYIDFEKAFDWVDRNMLFYKLFNYNVDGKLCKAIEAMYNCTRCAIKVNNTFTGWFKTSSGVRQGDTLSPTLFNIFINDLIEDLHNMHCGIETDDFSLSVLRYADDIVVISESEVNLQKMLDYLHIWCRKWRSRVNTNKSTIMHVRPKRRQRTQFLFKFRYGDSI